MAYAIKDNVDNTLMFVEYQEMWDHDHMCYRGMWTMEASIDHYTIYSNEGDADYDLWCLVTDLCCNKLDYEIVEV